MTNMRKVAVLGVGMVPFGRHEESLVEMLGQAALRALDDSSRSDRLVDALYVGNMAAGLFNHQSAVASALVDHLGLLPAAADVVENGPASGGSALKNGVLAVASGCYDHVLVVGGEKMKHLPGPRVTDNLATMAHSIVEYPYGATLPALAGMFARLYMSKYGVTAEHLAKVAVKNHANGALNPYAHFRKAITLEEILTGPQAAKDNPIVADPLRLYDCCPTSDGAAAVLLCPAEDMGRSGRPQIIVAGTAQATDTHSLQERAVPTELAAVRIVAQKAFALAGLAPHDVDVAELHDAFTVLEIAESEEVGFFPRGEGAKALEEGRTQIDGDLPISPSGGLKARGHPPGATGIAQVAELVWQLRGEAGPRQVKGAEIGFSVNLGGLANNAVAFVLQAV
jgi:acetyl-CoA C-acetyltransferase